MLLVMQVLQQELLMLLIRLLQYSLHHQHLLRGNTAVGTAIATDFKQLHLQYSELHLKLHQRCNNIYCSCRLRGFIFRRSFNIRIAGPESFTATVTATDASSNAATQVIAVSIRDSGGIDDNNALYWNWYYNFRN